MRILAVDPGEKRIGIAISDLTGTIANPLTVIRHISRLNDATRIAQMTTIHEVDLIVIGQSLDENGQPSFEGRRAGRLADALHTQTDTPIILWDEGFSTQDARLARINMNVSRKKRSGHMDELAATVILQSYLDAQVSHM